MTIESVGSPENNANQTVDVTDFFRHLERWEFLEEIDDRKHRGKTLIIDINWKDLGVDDQERRLASRFLKAFLESSRRSQLQQTRQAIIRGTAAEKRLADQNVLSSGVDWKNIED
ncbi:hypothetical protein HYW32_02530 [Candidatus Berkelbacteria bacterium]|nr:hypothetical protein [Candidatus Berkelbacteria bacterium]